MLQMQVLNGKKIRNFWGSITLCIFSWIARPATRLLILHVPGCYTNNFRWKVVKTVLKQNTARLRGCYMLQYSKQWLHAIVAKSKTQFYFLQRWQQIVSQRYSKHWGVAKLAARRISACNKDFSLYDPTWFWQVRFYSMFFGWENIKVASALHKQ